MLEKIPFHDLNRFKEESQDSEIELYNVTKQRVQRYRAAFFTLGIVFLSLCWIIDQKSALWFTSFIKPVVELAALLLGIASFTICAFLRYETESVRALYHHSLGRLKQSYKIKKAKASQDADLPAKDMLKMRISLWGHYAQAKEKLKKYELDTLELMERITRTKELKLDEKEHLYNLALLELKQKYLPILKEYTQIP